MDGREIGVADLVSVGEEDVLVLERSYVPAVMNRIRVYHVPLSVKPTTEGVMRLPSSFVMTLGSRPSMMATTLFVVPRSIPIIFATAYPPKFIDYFRPTTTPN